MKSIALIVSILFSVASRTVKCNRMKNLYDEYYVNHSFKTCVEQTTNKIESNHRFTLCYQILWNTFSIFANPQYQLTFTPHHYLYKYLDQYCYSELFVENALNYPHHPFILSQSAKSPQSSRAAVLWWRKLHQVKEPNNRLINNTYQKQNNAAIELNIYDDDEYWKSEIFAYLKKEKDDQSFRSSACKEKFLQSFLQDKKKSRLERLYEALTFKKNLGAFNIVPFIRLEMLFLEAKVNWDQILSIAMTQQSVEAQRSTIRKGFFSLYSYLFHIAAINTLATNYSVQSYLIEVLNQVLKISASLSVLPELFKTFSMKSLREMPSIYTSMSNIILSMPIAIELLGSDPILRAPCRKGPTSLSECSDEAKERKYEIALDLIQKYYWRRQIILPSSQWIYLDYLRAIIKNLVGRYFLADFPKEQLVF